MLNSSQDTAPKPKASAVSLRPAAPSAGRLGSIGRKVDSADVTRANRLAKFAAKRTSASLLRRHDEKLAGRISACCYTAFSDGVSLDRVTRADGSVTGAFSGVVTCSSVWSCPVCSARISLKRRDELNHLLAFARSAGHEVVMLTLTARHDARTKLAPFLDDLKRSFKSLRQSRSWRALPLIGTVTATEVTHGANGWHPHLHILMVLEAGSGSAFDLVETLRAQWLHQLLRHGRNGNGAAFQVQDASAAGEYIGKFGAGEELALGSVKQGRGAGSRSPWQILSDARDGCSKSCALWVEYSLAFKGKRQLHWSAGLKDLCGVNEVSDADCDDSNPIIERVSLRVWGAATWPSARRRLCALFDAVEMGADLDSAEFGLTDAERWRAELASLSVLETVVG